MTHDIAPIPAIKRKKTHIIKRMLEYSVRYFKPSLISFINGFFIAIEAKSGNNKPTALQTKHLREIKDTGGIALVINEFNVADIEAHIKLARNIT